MNNKVFCGSMVAIGACVFVIGASVCMCDRQDRLSHEYVKRHMELAYLYGQSDALSGIVRVAKNDSVWYYTRTPWDEPADSAHVTVPDLTVPVKQAEKDPFSIKY